LEVFVWLAKLLRWGNFKRVAKPIYYRLDHPRSFTSEYYNLSEDRKRAIWTTLFTGLLDAAMPLCHTPKERLFLQQTIVDLMVIDRTKKESNLSGQLMTECLERLSYEGNADLLSQKEISLIFQEHHAGWTSLNCSSGPPCGGLCIKSAGGPEWRNLFIQGPECRGLSIKSVTYSREQEIKSSGWCFVTGKHN
jgi:hypothetical protein